MFSLLAKDLIFFIIISLKFWYDYLEAIVTVAKATCKNSSGSGYVMAKSKYGDWRVQRNDIAFRHNLKWTTHFNNVVNVSQMFTYTWVQPMRSESCDRLNLGKSYCEMAYVFITFHIQIRYKNKSKQWLVRNIL